MKHLQELMAKAARLAELEMTLPLQKDELAVLKETVSDRKTERDWAALEARNLEEPGFFQRLLGRVAEKQEKAQTEAREAAAAYEKAKRELDELEHKLALLQSEYDALASSREAYDRERQTFLRIASDTERAQLQDWEIDTFRPVAITCLRLIRKDLNRSHAWMQKSERPRYSGYETRQMEYWDLADLHAEHLQSLLPYFPSGSIILGASMTCPSDYIRSASMNLGQLDRLNIAIDQSLRVQEQLEKL